MQTISEDYRSLNEKLHENDSYGVSGQKWAGVVMEMSQAIGTQDVLDYGCGKSTLAQSLPFIIKQYDPAIKKYSDRPRPADIVVCTDVLEHIEPDLIDNVLDDLKDLTKKAGFFVIANRPAKKTLEDGRNAHLIQEGLEWWLPKLWERFRIINMNNYGGEFLVAVEAK